MPDRIRLDGKVAIVTGAAGVIGTATIRLLAERGARIVAVDRSERDLKAAVMALPAAAEALAITADVTSEDEVSQYVRAAVDKFGTVDIFYNNAGIEGEIAPITKYPLETFRRVLDVNVVGVFLGLKHVLPVMLKQNKGSIVNTASIAGLIGSPEVAAYSASKHAVIGLTKSAALECTTTGVRVNCVCPGLIDSRMLSAIIEGRNPAEARELYLKGRVVSNPEPPQLKSVEPLAIPAPQGSIPARVYTPTRLREANGLAPCLVFFHGGGWVIGDLDSHDVVCRKLADEGQLIVISVDYRLAPEHKFPAAVDDAIAATTWIAAKGKSLGIDQSRLMVGGDSAGGNLAAVVAIAARKGGGPAIAAQVLIYPAIDFALTHPSHREPETSILLTHSVIRWFRDHYLNSAADVEDWRSSPARAKSLSGLPPAYVLTAGADPLRDEGDEYAQRLKQAGVAVTHRTFPGQFHGFFTMGKLLQQANVAVAEIGTWLKALN